MIGQTLGRYQILAKLGEGGMGEVFRAADTKLGRAVALKVLPSAVAGDPERLARFEREARAVAALNHPNIVTLYSVEHAPSTGSGQDAVHFLTMELVEGEELGQLIPGQGCPIDQVLTLGGALADALAAAHDKGIVHRDLKPANVMRTADGRLKVLDFGLAKEMREKDRADATMTAAGHTQAGIVMGTPAYMSPEQLGGRPLDHRTDIFSLGILLYQMCTGGRPFDGSTSIELASAILRDTPQPLEEVRADVPADLARLIRRCLEKDPQRRVQTARDVGNEIRDIVRERAIGPRGVSSGSVASRVDEGFWVAVLPFKYGGSDAAVQGLAEGLSEEIVTGLSRFSYLRVIARSSTSRYGVAAADVRTIAREIGARYVMEGSVRQAGTQLRVAVQLVDATNGANLWAETFNRSFQPDAIFDVQDDLVPRIVSTVADVYGVLPRNLGDALRDRGTDLTPYEAVLRGWSYYGRISPDEHAEVRAVVERALAEANDHPDLWALQSMLCQDEYRHGFNPRPEPLARALAAARRAVDLAPANHFAYHVLASALFFRRDLHAFRRAGERAIELNPMDCNSVAYMGSLIAFAGDWTYGIEVVERARRLNPHHPGWLWMPLKGRHHLAKVTPESMELARRCYESAVELDPAFGLAQVGIGFYWLGLAIFGDCPTSEAVPAARAVVRRALQTDPSIPEAHALLGFLAGLYDLDWAAAERHFEFPMARQVGYPITRPIYGGLQFFKGNYHAAIEMAERAIEEDPLEVWPRMNLHAYLQAVGRDREAHEQALKVLELDENLVVARVSIAHFHADWGQLGEAVAAARRAYASSPWYPDAVATLAALLKRSGEEDESCALFDSLGSSERAGDVRAKAVYYLLCGDLDQAADYAEKAIALRDNSMMYYLRFVISRQLRASARWPAIARMLNLSG